MPTINVSAASVGIVLLAMCGDTLGFDDPVTKTEAAAIDIHRLTLEQLIGRLDTDPHDSSETSDPRYETIFCEITRRGGRDAAAALRRIIKLRREKLESELLKLNQQSDDEKLFNHFKVKDAYGPNLELVTSLRRIEKQPDPLEITITNLDKITAGTRVLPILNVQIRNVDSEKFPVWFQDGGDNRSGRHDRWRIHVWDSKGNLLQERGRLSGVGGGLFDFEFLKYGEVWTAVLPMSRYVSIPAAGEYTVQVLYHNELTIADFEDAGSLEGLLLFKSEPFKLKVEHGPVIKVRVPAASHTVARALIQGLNGNSRVQIVVGQYTKSLHEFIPPKSAQGKLLAMQWEAVPALLEALEDKSMPVKQRAWVFALLFSITNEESLDPRAAGDALSSYDVRGLTTTVTSSSGGHSFSVDVGRFTFFGTESVLDQQALADKWRKFQKEYLDIVIEK